MQKWFHASCIGLEPGSVALARWGNLERDKCAYPPPERSAQHGIVLRAHEPSLIITMRVVSLSVCSLPWRVSLKPVVVL